MKNTSMSRSIFWVSVAACLLAFVMFGVVGVAYAADGGGDQCVTCHRMQYQNLDNGKSFCLDEAPMHCVDCHGGNPYATTKEEAHFDRSAHPVIEDNVSRCYICHLDDADAKVESFGKVAGLSAVHLEADHEPVESVYVGFPEVEEEQGAPLSAGSIGIAVGFGLAAFLIRKARVK